MPEFAKIPSEELRERQYRICNIDLDAVLFRAAVVCDKVKYELKNEDGEMIDEFQSAKDCKEYIEEARDVWEDDVSGWVRETVKVSLKAEEGIKAFESLIKNIKFKVKSDKYNMYLGDGGNFRDSLATIRRYKGERAEKPTRFEEVRKYVIDKYSPKLIRGREVDDVVSCLSWNEYKKSGEDPYVIMVNQDKDLENTPSVHYNFVKDQFFYFSKEEADFNFFRQLLTGDLSVDNIQGLPDISPEFRTKWKIPKWKGVGKATAEKILNGCNNTQEMYSKCLEAYESYYSNPYEYKHWDGSRKLVRTPEEIMIENGNLLWMERTKGYTFSDELEKGVLKGLRS